MDIIIPIITILGSGVVSAYVAQKLVNSRSEKDFKRKKLEELFLAIDKYCLALSSANLAWPRVAKGQLTYDQALDSIINLDKEQFAGVFETAQMIIGLYFPELNPNLQAILDVRSRLTKLQHQFKTTYMEKGPVSEFADKFSAELIAIERASEEFKKRLSIVAAKI